MLLEMQINCPLWNHCLPVLRCIQRTQTDLSGLTFFSWAVLWLALSKWNTAKWSRPSKPPLWLAPWISCTTPPWTTAPPLPGKPPACQDPGLFDPYSFTLSGPTFGANPTPWGCQDQILFHSRPWGKSPRHVGGFLMSSYHCVLLAPLPSPHFEPSSQITFSPPTPDQKYLKYPFL